MRGTLALFSISWLLLMGSAAFPVAQQAPVATERVVVVFGDHVADPQAAALDLTARHEATLGFVYRHALRGFSAEVPSHRLDALARDPRVAYVEPDHVFHTFAQALPTGIDRVEVDKNPHAAVDGTDQRVDVDIAVIDTGVDYTHPDLYVTKATDCTTSVLFPHCTGDGNLIDENGHGTHVAGTAAALDNDQGVVGVAPGARLWSVKVLDANGSGFLSWIIAGIDIVTQHATDIDVANMSLGCECSSSALDDAITNSVAAGVVYAVAAGNSGKDASTFSPANHPDVITVSALADFDGLAGAGGSPTCRDDQDDTLADFSNYGPLVELAAPGVCITSTWLDGGYNTISGTSMASPHVAGAAALYVAAYGRDRNGDGTIDKADVDAVRATLVEAALPQDHDCGYTNERADLGSVEPLLFINALALGGDGSCDTAGGNQPPTVAITQPAEGATVSGTVNVTADASDDDAVTEVEFSYQADGGSFVIDTDTDGSDGWSASWDTSGLGDGSYTVTATATDTAGQIASHTISVTVDNVDNPPTVAMTDPADGQAVSGTVTVVADASDDDDVTQVAFSYQADGGTFPIGTDTAGSDGWSVPWDTNGLSDGSYGLTATATDTAGQTASDSISVTVDNTAPFVSITSPAEGETVGGAIEVTATASDESPTAVPTSGVAQVEFFVNGTSIGVDADGSDGWSAAWDTTTVDNGTHTVTATATDGAGNTASDSVSVTVENTGDPNAMYVWEIVPTTSRSGPWTNVTSTVTVLRDADADGAEGTDEPVSGARVTYRLERDAGCDGTYESVFDFRTDKTNSSGQVTFNLKTQAPDGCWQGTVTELTHGTYSWDVGLDRNNPRLWEISNGSIQ